MTNSDHAEIRMQQRGCRKDATTLVFLTADRRINVGDGCVLISLSHARAKAMRRAGFSNSIMSRAERLGLIVSPDGVTVTALVGAMIDRTTKRAKRH